MVPFSAHIESDTNFNEIKRMVSARSTKECNLLFLCTDWKRKGGEMAIKVAARLNDTGLKTVLQIAGIKDLPVKPVPAFIINHGCISKASKEGEASINELFMRSHFLIQPSIADRTTIVYGEANAFGSPCISSDVGGISTILKSDTNGKLFSLKEDEDAYSEYIRSVFTNNRLYKQLCDSSFVEYEKRLNWKVAGRSITNLLKQLLYLRFISIN